jgi:hypothetical protein
MKKSSFKGYHRDHAFHNRGLKLDSLNRRLQNVSYMHLCSQTRTLKCNYQMLDITNFYSLSRGVS